MIILNGLGKGYRDRGGEINWVIRDFTGALPDGVNVGILARPGQGKTTLIRLLAGIDIPTEGRIVRKSAVSFPFGFRGYLSGRLTIRQNVRFICDLYGQDFAVVLENVLSITGLSNDGMQLNRATLEQRSLIAAALFFSLNFSHMLFDEIEGAGAPRMRNRIYQMMDNRLPHQSHVIITETPDLLQRFCTQGGVLDRGRLTLYPTVDLAIAEYLAIGGSRRAFA